MDDFAAVIPYLPVSMPVQPNHLVCGSAVTRHTPFNLSIQALVPAPAPLKATIAH
jgi:hypothetical protein